MIDTYIHARYIRTAKIHIHMLEFWTLRMFIYKQILTVSGHICPDKAATWAVYEYVHLCIYIYIYDVE